jgi:hypothetical protein
MGNGTVVREKEGWRIKYNYELYDLYNAPKIAKTVKLGRLGWLGHLSRANEISPCGEPPFSKPEDTKRAGRPSLSLRMESCNSDDIHTNDVQK